MFKFLSGVVVSAAIAVSATLGLIHSMPEAKTDFSQLQRATVKLTTPIDGFPKEFCSGVVISDYTVLTAAHCDLGKEREVFVRGYKATVIKKNEKMDLMLLHVPYGVLCPCVSAITVPQAMDKVYAVGYPLDKGFVITEGTYQSEDRDGVVLFTAPVIYGNSGGGLFKKTENGWSLVAIITHGTIVPIGGFIPAFVGHLNHGSGANNIYKFITNDDGV